MHTNNKIHTKAPSITNEVYKEVKYTTKMNISLYKTVNRKTGRKLQNLKTWSPVPNNTHMELTTSSILHRLIHIPPSPSHEALMTMIKQITDMMLRSSHVKAGCLLQASQQATVYTVFKKHIETFETLINIHDIHKRLYQDLTQKYNKLSIGT